MVAGRGKPAARRDNLLFLALQANVVAAGDQGCKSRHGDCDAGVFTQKGNRFPNL
jgi:hypothetical protein